MSVAVESPSYRRQAVPEAMTHPRCATCGALLSWLLLRSHQGENLFCGECRHTSRPFDATDPYDDIGGEG